MKRIALAAVLAALVGCGGSSGGGSGETDASPDGLAKVASDATGADVAEGSSFEAAASSLDAGAVDSSSGDDGEGGPDPCANSAVPPTTLECAGLYSDFASQTLSPLAQAYAPAVPLWSDGATKRRWIELPPGTQIDVTNPDEWVFPVGTKLFKEFTYEGKRVETRMFWKTVITGHTTWVHATYVWNADDSATTISYGDTVPAGPDGGTWVIPTPQDCDSCHNGRLDHILGFEQVSLGLDGATGLTLLQLVVKGLVNPPPTQVNLRIGDDGTGLDAPALGWLHINCGVTCHNTNTTAEGYGAGMHLRLDPALLDGTPANATWDPLATTINVPAISGSVAGLPRILPGNPAASVIVQLISQRGILQMPPIATRFVDTTNVAAVEAWIQHMPAGDAGTPAGTPDGGSDGESDAPTGQDATATDSGTLDATLTSDAASSSSGDDAGAAEEPGPDTSTEDGGPE
jgi:hypothetical protein